MFDITKFLQSQQAKEDKIAKLVKRLSEKGSAELISRKDLRDHQGFKRCCKKERKLLKHRFEANNIVVIGNLTLHQDDHVHLVSKYSSLYKNFKRHFEVK